MIDNQPKELIMSDTPKLAPATIERTEDGYRVVVKWEPHSTLDRLDAHAWGLRPRDAALAHRLKTAIDAGVIFEMPGKPYTDIDGQRGRHVSSRILARIMNAELRRLGY